MMCLAHSTYDCKKRDKYKTRYCCYIELQEKCVKI